MSENLISDELRESLKKLANKDCKKCNGSGNLGFRIVKGMREPVLCNGKECSQYNFNMVKLIEKYEKNKVKKEEQTQEEDSNEENN